MGGDPSDLRIKASAFYWPGLQSKRRVKPRSVMPRLETGSTEQPLAPTIEESEMVAMNTSEGTLEIRAHVPVGTPDSSAYGAMIPAKTRHRRSAAPLVYPKWATTSPISEMGDNHTQLGLIEDDEFLLLKKPIAKGEMHEQTYLSSLWTVLYYLWSDMQRK